MRELEDGDPPEKLEDWPDGKAKYDDLRRPGLRVRLRRGPDRQARPVRPRVPGGRLDRDRAASRLDGSRERVQAASRSPRRGSERDERARRPRRRATCASTVTRRSTARTRVEPAADGAQRRASRERGRRAAWRGVAVVAGVAVGRGVAVGVASRVGWARRRRRGSRRGVRGGRGRRGARLGVGVGVAVDGGGRASAVRSASAWRVGRRRRRVGGRAWASASAVAVASASASGAGSTSHGRRRAVDEARDRAGRARRRGCGRRRPRRTTLSDGTDRPSGASPAGFARSTERSAAAQLSP